MKVYFGLSWHGRRVIQKSSCFRALMSHWKRGEQRPPRSHKNRLKLLFLTIFLLILSSGVGASMISKACASETSTHEEMLAVLKDLVGLDLTKYATETKGCPKDLYLGVLPEENIECILESSGSRLRVVCTFVNKTLQLIYVSDCVGSPHMAQSATADTLEMAKDFLNRYYAYSEGSYIQEMRSILDEIDGNQNITKTSGNVTLKVTVTQRFTEFIWTYTFNGVQASSKRVSLSFEKGFLKHFFDSWWLYKIGSYVIKVDEKEAIEIAVNAAKNYSWKTYIGNDTWIEVTNFNTVEIGKPKLSFINYMSEEEARSRDPLTLYPEWSISLGLDKAYPGGVTGINVGVWADTGEISYIGLMTFGSVPPSNEHGDEQPNEVAEHSSNEEFSNDKVNANPTTSSLTLLLFLSIIITAAAVVYFKMRKPLKRRAKYIEAW